MSDFMYCKTSEEGLVCTNVAIQQLSGSTGCLNQNGGLQLVNEPWKTIISQEDQLSFRYLMHGVFNFLQPKDPLAERATKHGPPNVLQDYTVHYLWQGCVLIQLVSIHSVYY